MYDDGIGPRSAAAATFFERAPGFLPSTTSTRPFFFGFTAEGLSGTAGSTASIARTVTNVPGSFLAMCPRFCPCRSMLRLLRSRAFREDAITPVGLLFQYVFVLLLVRLLAAGGRRFRHVRLGRVRRQTTPASRSLPRTSHGGSVTESTGEARSIHFRGRP